MSDVAIPHQVKPHPVTGIPNGKFAIWLFLASEVMLFGALFSSYVLLRFGASNWPRGHDMLNWKLAAFNTMVLITSSVTMVWAWADLKLKNFAGGRRWLLATFLLAGTFLVVKYFEYKDKLTHYDITKTDGTFVSGHLVKQTGDTWVIHPAAPEAHGGDHTAEVTPASSHEVTIKSDEIAKAVNWGPWNQNFLAVYWVLTGLHGLHILGGMVVIAYLAGPGAGLWKKDPEFYTNRVENTGLYWHFVDLVWIFLFPVLYLM